MTHLSYVEDLDGGYVTLTNAWVQRWLPDLSGYAVSVYIVLKKTGGQKHCSFYGLKALEQMTGQSRERLLKSIAELEKHGLLIVERGTTQAGDAATNIYYIAQTSADTGEVVRYTDHPSIDHSISGHTEKPTGSTSGGVVRHADHVVGGAHHGGTPRQRGSSTAQTTVVRRTDTKHIKQTTASQAPTSKTTTSPSSDMPSPGSDVVVDSEKSAPGGTAMTSPADAMPKNAAMTALVETGVRPDRARQIVAARGERLVLDWLAVVAGKYVNTTKNGPAAFLVAALGGEAAYNLPKRYLDAKESARKRAAQQEEDTWRAELRTQAERQARREQERRETRWEALAAQQRAKIEDQVRQEIEDRPMGKRLLAGPIGKETLRKRCLEVVAETGILDIAGTFYVDDVAASPRVPQCGKWRA